MGPGLSYWLSIIAFPLALIGGLAHLSLVLSRFDYVDDLGEWRKDEGIKGDSPEWIAFTANKAPVALLGIAGLLLLSAVILPWYDIEQDWHMYDSDEETGTSEPTGDVLEFNWGISPWYVRVVNDTTLTEGENGSSQTSITSHSEQPFLIKTTAGVAEMRWPLLCALLFVIASIPLLFIGNISEKIGGTKGGWSMLLLFCLALTIMWGTDNLVEELGPKSIDELNTISPDPNIDFSNINDDDGTGYFKGFAYETEGWNIKRVALIEVTWGEGLGAIAASYLPWVLLILFALMVSDEWDGLVPAHGEKFSTPSLDMWKEIPTLSVVILLLLFTGWGSGLGNAIIDPSFSEEAEPLFQWEYGGEDITVVEDTDWVVLGDGESLSISFLPSAAGHTNISRLYFSIICSEGERGIVSDEADEIDWEVIPPAGINNENTNLMDSGTDSTDGDCAWGNNWYFDNGDLTYPEDGTWAKNKEEALTYAESPPEAAELWTLQITARINGGSTPADIDNGVDVRLVGEYVNYIWNATVMDSN